MKNPVWPSSCVTTAGTSNELDVQNEWEENTHTHSIIGQEMFLTATMGCNGGPQDEKLLLGCTVKLGWCELPRCVFKRWFLDLELTCAGWCEVHDYFFLYVIF